MRSGTRMAIRGGTIPAILAIGVLFAGGGTAGTGETPLARIERRIAELPRTAEVGISLVSLDTGKPLLEIDADRPMIPASVTKIFTVSAALARLGPAYRFKTRVFADAPVAPDGSVGTLYLVGSGDPSLVIEELWRLVHNLHLKSGLRSVQARIVLDDSAFDDDRKPDGWGDRNALRAYTAPVSALSFNFNAVRFLVGGGGGGITLRWDPKTAYLEIEDRLRMGKRTKVSFVRQETRRGDRFILSGTVGRSQPLKTYYRSVSKPTWYTGWNFVEFLAREGITVPPRLERDKTPANAHLLLEHESRDLAEIVRDMGKFSNNFVAEHLLKALGSEVFSPPGTTQKGSEALAAYLREIGLGEGFRFVDGSGLSRENRVSARQTTTLLTHAYRTFEQAPEFLSMLPISAVDGTLRRRMAREDLAGRVRAKTGSISGVDTLAGYFVAASGEPFAFAILINDSPSRPRNIAVIDRIVQELAAIAEERSARLFPQKGENYPHTLRRAAARR